MSNPNPVPQERMHALDAVRAFALLLGVVLHATESFLPGMERWIVVDQSPSTTLSVAFYVIHQFRMSLFFVMAGFFAHLVYHRKGSEAFIADRRKRILIPFLVSWPVIMTMFGAVYSLAQYLIASGALTPPSTTSSRGSGVPLAHLWFLYYLLLLYVIILAARSVILRFDHAGAWRKRIDGILRHAVEHHWAPFVLAAPLCAYLYNTRWLMWFGIATPDMGLLPQLPALIGFGTAFGFGWLLHRQTQLLQVWERRWPIYFIAAGALTMVCLSLAGLTPSYTPAAMDATKRLYAVCYTLSIWTWTFAFIGVALQLFSAHTAGVRYLADASYWIYLVHLPLVMAMQVAVAPWSWHWGVKFPLVLAVSFALLFLSYRYWVRYSFIGERLNGRKHPRPSSTEALATTKTSLSSD